MEGKSYYCDYCFCYLKSDINVRKIHNSGLSHQMAKLRYMRRFEDPRKLLAEECEKEPCTRYLNGRYCKFDLICNSTHFSQKQLERLRKIAEKHEKIKARKAAKNLLKQSHESINLPWLTGAEWMGNKRSRQKIKHLPESVKPINFNRMSNDFAYPEWG